MVALYIGDHALLFCVLIQTINFANDRIILIYTIVEIQQSSPINFICLHTSQSAFWLQEFLSIYTNQEHLSQDLCMYSFYVQALILERASILQIDIGCTMSSIRLSTACGFSAVTRSVIMAAILIITHVANLLNFVPVYAREA